MFFILSMMLICGVSHSQDNGRKPLQGKISIGEVTADPGEIAVRNLQTKKNTATTNGGFFTIVAKAGDSLYFSGKEIVSMKMIISNEDSSKEMLNIVLTPAGTQLKEVTVNGKNINSKSVGLNPSGQKTYTPAERRLAVARKVTPQRKPADSYAAIGTDPLINAVSGKSKDLKKQAQVEKKESSKAQLSEMYDHTYFTDSLKIPADYVEGFLYYAIEDKKLIKTLDSGLKLQLDYQLTSLATEYKKTIKGESK